MSGGTASPVGGATAAGQLGWPHIDVMVINMSRSPDRLAHMRRELNALGIPWKRFEAVDGRAVPISLRGFFGNKSSLKAGEIGCYASHLAIWQRIAEEKHGPVVLVLEDDLSLARDFPATLSAAVAAMPSDWDILRLSNLPKRPFLALLPLGAGHWLARYSRIPNNTGAYLITRCGAAKLLGGPRPRSRAVDEDLRRPWQFGIRTYGIVPPPVVSNIFDSAIDAMEDRGLRPTARRGPRLRLGRLGDPVTAVRRLGWSIRDLGLRAWLACMGRTLRVLLRPGPRPKGIGSVDVWRVGPLGSRYTSTQPTGQMPST